MIFHAWVNRRYFCERDQNPVLTGFGKLLVLACTSKVESRERLQNCHILMILWQVMKEYMYVACMFWCMPSTFMLEWAIWSLYWVLRISLLGVFTNLCCKTVDVRKRQCIISKNKIIDQSINNWSNSSIKLLINQSINQSINHQLGFMMTGVGKEKKEFGMRFRNVVVTKLGR